MGDVKWSTASLGNSQIRKKNRLRVWDNPHHKHERVIEELFATVRNGDLELVEIAVSKSPKEALKGRD